MELTPHMSVLQIEDLTLREKEVVVKVGGYLS